MALEILSLPKSLGANPNTGKDIKAGVGRFGPYVVCDGDYRSIPKTESVFTMNLEKALALFAVPKKGRGKAAAIKEFGKHPQHDIEVSLFNGPYGPYLKAGKTNVGLPEGVTVDNLTAEKAYALINEKLGDSPASKPTKKKSGAKKAAPKSGTPKSLKSANTSADKAVALGVKKVIVKKKK